MKKGKTHMRKRRRKKAPRFKVKVKEVQVKPIVKKTNFKPKPKPIKDIARVAGIKIKHLEPYGKYKAKLSFELTNNAKKKQKGKYVIVTSITPTPFGEGKSLIAIGLSMALRRMKKKAIPVITQPSLSKLFGNKGTYLGAGSSCVLPKEEVNIHVTGDSHAVTCANNICAAYLDNSIYYGNPFNLDLESIGWRRVVEANDRSLRNINIGLGSKADGISRKSGFEATTTSELMAILALAENIKDLKERLNSIIVGFTEKGKPVTCENIKIAGTMAVLLKDAMRPTLLETSEQTPCFMHTGSCVEASLGFSSLVADRTALRLSDYAISEAGSGTELGLEKCLDIKCRVGNIKPDAVIIVCTVRAFKMHSGDYEVTESKIQKDITRENVSAVERGLSNLEKHIENVKSFGLPSIVCINRFSSDTEKEIAAIKRRAIDVGANAVALSDVCALGSEGGIELAETVIKICKEKNSFRFLYPVDMSIKDKIKRIARTLYGAKDITLSDMANKKAAILKKAKIDNLPVCIAKTPLSFSVNPNRKGRPHGFKLHVEDIEIFRGAGFIVAYCENALTMPGLISQPAGTKVDLDENGKIIGLS